MMSFYTMAPLAGGTGFVPRYQYLSPSYTTLDARLARRFKIDSTQFEVAAVATNLGPHHQEIADRSEQFLHGSGPGSRTSPMIWLTLSIGINQTESEGGGGKFADKPGSVVGSHSSGTAVTDGL